MLPRNSMIARAVIEYLLSGTDVENIHAYLIDQSWVAYRAQEAAAHEKPLTGAVHVKRSRHADPP